MQKPVLCDSVIHLSLCAASCHKVCFKKKKKKKQVARLFPHTRALQRESLRPITIVAAYYLGTLMTFTCTTSLIIAFFSGLACQQDQYVDN